MKFGNYAYGVVVEESQIANLRRVFAKGSIFAQIIPIAGHGVGACVARSFCGICTGIVETEGDEHCRPVTIGHSVPCTVSGVAAANAVLILLEVQFAFGVAQLGAGYAYQIRSEIAGVGIGGKHVLPIQHGFNICCIVRVAINAVDMLFQFAD